MTTMTDYSQWRRKIIHIDMDAFYAAIEQRDQPQYRGKPVIVGGDPHGRGVVCTCSNNSSYPMVLSGLKVDLRWSKRLGTKA